MTKVAEKVAKRTNTRFVPNPDKIRSFAAGSSPLSGEDVGGGPRGPDAGFRDTD